jgi:hypothetical protein
MRYQFGHTGGFEQNPISTAISTKYRPLDESGIVGWVSQVSH